MKTATISELKKEMQTMNQGDLVTLCLRLARFKAENKELLSYLVFEQHDALNYATSVKKLIEDEMLLINFRKSPTAKKSIRKLGRLVGKHIRMTGSKRVEAELLIHFCRKLRGSGFPFDPSSPMHTFYNTQLQKLNRAIGTLHPDLQFDYRTEMKGLDQF